MDNGVMLTENALRCVAKNIELYYKNKAPNGAWCITTCRSAAAQFEKMRSELAELRRAQPENKPLTNADRIRSMSDEELAEYIFGLGNGPENCDGHCAYQDDCNAEGFNYNTCIKACIKGVTDWLKQPVRRISYEAD
jgi:hypothetical protein